MLPPRDECETLSLAAAGKVLGIGRGSMYELARKDELPVPVIRIGRRMVISKRAIDALLNERKADEDVA
jgi:predicted DNA-binding transcriptional regulator AlpA